ncbi:auxin efflux carrier component 1b-related [Anaeramoeba flamelloides]|uniref:Auxin efflux carrier component 1b-related n=1 Tax=Anaeramoeba flamelloides TaxID=1746091 RepID=A0ABQ8X746_9EUKA|nr:auxin efflux carrier component 1b-related [Anaeramoeba flamelloides]
MDSIFPKSFLIYPILASLPLTFLQMPFMIVICEIIEAKREIKRKMETDIEDVNSSSSTPPNKKHKTSTNGSVFESLSQNNKHKISENKKILVENGQEGFELEEVDYNNDDSDKCKDKGKDIKSDGDSDRGSDSHIGGGSSSDNSNGNKKQSTSAQKNDNQFEIPDLKKKIFKLTLKRVFINPVLISVIIGFIYSSSGLPFPEVLAKPVQTLSNMVLPLAMITIGMFVYQHKIISCSCKTMLMFVSIKSFLVPFVSLSAFLLFGIKGDAGKAAFLLSVMPAGISTFQFGTE